MAKFCISTICLVKCLNILILSLGRLVSLRHKLFLIPKEWLVYTATECAFHLKRLRSSIGYIIHNLIPLFFLYYNLAILFRNTLHYGLHYNCNIIRFPAILCLLADTAKLTVRKGQQSFSHFSWITKQFSWVTEGTICDAKFIKRNC